MAASTEALEDRLRDVERESQSNESRIASHEELCAERYRTINASIGDINRNVRWAAISLLGGMAAILVKLLFFPTP